MGDLLFDLFGVSTDEGVGEFGVVTMCLPAAQKALPFDILGQIAMCVYFGILKISLFERK